MKLIALLGITFASGSLATSPALSGLEHRLNSIVDVDGPTEDVLPTRTVELHKRRKGGGGGGDIDFEDYDDDDDDDGDSYNPPPCLETKYYLTDPRSNRWGYGAFPAEGPGSDESEIVGGYTKNGSGTPPEWRRANNGSWVMVCDYDYKYKGDEYYFAGSEVPYLAGEKSPNGLEPFLTDPPFPEDTYSSSYWSLLLCRDRLEVVYGCPLQNSSYCYKYLSPYEYTESSRRYDSDIDGFEYKNETTKTIDVLCCCSKNHPCTCDDPGQNLVKAIGDYYSGFDDYGTAELDNTTYACYMELNGSNVLAINGTLEMGSTKANASLPDIPPVEHTNICYTDSSPPVLLYGVSYPVLLTIASGVVWLSS